MADIEKKTEPKIKKVTVKSHGGGMLMFFGLLIFLWWQYDSYLESQEKKTTVIIWEFPSPTDSIIVRKEVLKEGQQMDYSPENSYWWDETGKQHFSWPPYRITPDCGKTVDIRSYGWPSSVILTGCSFGIPDPDFPERTHKTIYITAL